MKRGRSLSPAKKGMRTMPHLNEYEITGENGIVTRVQMTDDDAKKFPNAKKVGSGEHDAPKATETKADAPAADAPVTGHQHDQVSNRSRKTG